MTSRPTPYRSKTLATWVALLGGTLGLHRFYLHGLRDPWGWLYPLPTMLGLYGIERVQRFGQDDMLSWALVPLLGITVSAAMLSAIVYALTDDGRWHARYNRERGGRPSGWAAILGAALALLIGGAVLMATIAFSSQRYFEYQIEEARKISR